MPEANLVKKKLRTKLTDLCDGSSFRDPSGFIFTRGGVHYRQVNLSYRDNYKFLKTSGLCQDLTKAGLMVSYDEVNIDPPVPKSAYVVIKPQAIPFISYPYEWCFSQLRDAALLTLIVQKRALDHGMILKDASAFNIQFTGCKPIFIDTLSFMVYREGHPWVAYQQFCQHFLAPLALMSYCDFRLGQLLRIHIDGIPLDLASRLLPRKSWLSLGLSAHIHAHAKSQKRYAAAQRKYDERAVSKRGLLGLLDNLEATIKRLKWSSGDTVWRQYYEDTNYDEHALAHKMSLVKNFLEMTRSATVWDLGANVGLFSRIASDLGAYTIALDYDPAVVEKNYVSGKSQNSSDVLPLLMNLTNPSSGLGWAHRERISLVDRGPADTVLALALLHHLAIGNNVPFDYLAEFLEGICRTLIIEFIPKTDSQVRRLLASREDVFPWYTRENFEAAFSTYFDLEQQTKIENSDRILYLMRSRRLN